MKRISLILGALILIGGALIYFLTMDSPPKEASDLVVLMEKDASAKAPSEKKSENEQTVPPAPAAATAVNEAELKAIREELAEALDDLPTLEQLQDLSEEEVHHTPKVVTDGGKLIGRLISAADTQVLRREETANFLLSCAEKKDAVPAVRALCWNKLLKKIPDWSVFIPISEAQVPEDIQSLASKLDI